MMYTSEIFSQNNKIDSIQTLLKNSTEDTLKIKHINKLCSEYLNRGKYDSALYYGNMALELYKDSYYQGDIDFKKALSLSYNIIGNIYDEQGNYSQALENHFSSLKIRTEINDKKGIAASHNNIGNIFDDQGNHDKALENYFESIKIFEELEDKKGIAVVSVNIGNIYWHKENYEKALEYYNISLNLFGEIGNKRGITHSYTNIGNIYYQNGNFIKALDNYLLSLKIREEINDKKGVAMSYNNIGNVYYKQKKLSQAKSAYQLSLTLSKEIGAKDLMMYNYEILSSCDSIAGNWKESLEYYKLFTGIKDSMFNSESTEKIAEMNSKYETEKKEAQIILLEKDKEIQARDIAKQKAIRNAIGGGLMMVLIFFGLLGNRFLLIRKQKNIIQKQKAEVETQKNIVEEKNDEITSSIRYAKKIQEAILPPEKVLKEKFKDYFILYRPKDIVSGDFYWMVEKNNQIYFAIVDCTGHGVPGAFVSIVGYNSLNQCLNEFHLTKPSKILDKLNELVEQRLHQKESDVQDGMDISICSLNVSKLNDIGEITLEFAGANNPLYIIRDNKLIEYNADKQPIGIFSHRSNFTNHAIPVQKGDSIYIFTDGFACQFGGTKGKKFKQINFKNLLLSVQDKSMLQQKDIIIKAFDNWKGDLEQVDDICMMGIRI